MAALTLVLAACTPGAERAPQGATVATALDQPSVLAATAGWRMTGALTLARIGYTVTLLPNGKVLVMGGENTSVGFFTSAELYDPATGSWSPTGSLAQARREATATLLPNGKVLAVGGHAGGQPLKSAEVYDPATGTWTATGSLTDGRRSHSATLLPNGKVLVVGGQGSGRDLASAELYDPATGTWTVTGSMAQIRDYTTTTLLPNGKVLVAGGWGGPTSVLAACELYDPATGTWSSTAPMAHARYAHTLTLLPTGKVLAVGGWSLASRENTAELYDPATGTWTATGSLAKERWNHTATVLPTGKVLVAGGDDDTTNRLATTEVYDPATGTWTASASLAQARTLHTATLLPSGRVLAVGGYNAPGDTLGSAELYDVATGTWASVAPASQSRFVHTATLLPNGKVLVAGGLSGIITRATAELYDLATNTWAPTGSLAQARQQHTATVLPSGKVLVVGGDDITGNFFATAELYDPATGTWTSAGSLAQARSLHTATLLPDGRVLVTGGANATGRLTSVEVYDPATGAWTSAAPLPQARGEHTATLLYSGKVLVAGGQGSGPLTEAALYDPATNTWASTGELPESRYHHTATLLPSGKVLVAGGSVTSSNTPTRTELYDPATGTWSSGGDLLEGRKAHAMTLLPTGKVLILGGQGSTLSTTAELYDPATGTWTATGSLAQVRRGAAATLLLNGKVLVTSGADTSTILTSAEAYDDTGANPAWKPELLGVSPTTPLEPGNAFTVTGSRLRGLWEGSDGNVRASPTNFPLLTLLDLARGQLHAVPLQDFSGMHVTARVPSTAKGQFLLSITVNGLTSSTVLSLVGDTTVPDTLLASGPASPTQESTATFVFSATEADASFECRLDTGAFKTCVSPFTLSNLTDGNHTLQVRAFDGAGNVDATPASHSWSVDTTAPVTRLTSAPAPSTGQSTATFVFDASEAGASFECSLDDEGFSPCTSPFTVSNLTEGLHSFQVQALDALGNVEDPPASHVWTVDLTPPDTLLTSAPTTPSGATVTFTFSTNDVGASFECALDGAAFTACASPATYNGLADGSHTFSVRARDAVGNVDATPASHGWTADGGAPETLLTAFPLSPSNQPTATFAFSSEAGATFECSLDEAAFTACTSPASYANLAEGLHTFRVRARDAVGNVDASPARHQWVIDLPAPPAPVITSPRDGATLDDNTPAISGTAQPGSTVTVMLDGSVAGTTTADASGDWSFTPASPLDDGDHTVTATASDSNGTSPASAPVRFTVETVPVEPVNSGGGCACAAGPGDASWLLSGLALLAGVVSRRRRGGQMLS